MVLFASQLANKGGEEEGKVHAKKEKNTFQNKSRSGDGITNEEKEEEDIHINVKARGKEGEEGDERTKRILRRLI